MKRAAPAPNPSLHQKPRTWPIGNWSSLSRRFQQSKIQTIQRVALIDYMAWLECFGLAVAFERGSRAT
jgi:hypothetical protein